MTEDVQMSQTFAADLHVFEERVIDFALGAEQYLLSILQALETGKDQPARVVLEGEGAMREAGSLLRAQGLALQARYAPVGEALTRLVELQQALIEFARVIEHCQRAARHILTLAGTGLLIELLHSGAAPVARASSAMLSLLHALRRQVRSVILALVRPSYRQGQQLIAEAQVVGNYCAVAVVELQERIAADPPAALSLTRLLFVVYELRCIHERLIAIGHGAHYSAAAPSSVAI
jgi:hypothetical protein